MSDQPSERARAVATEWFEPATADSPGCAELAEVIDRHLRGYDALLEFAREASPFWCPKASQVGHGPCRLCDLLNTGRSALAAAGVEVG